MAHLGGFLEREMTGSRAGSAGMRKWELEYKNLWSERGTSEVQDLEQITTSEWKQYWNREDEMDIGIESRVLETSLQMFRSCKQGMKWRVKPWGSGYQNCKIFLGRRVGNGAQDRGSDIFDG